MNYGNTSSWYPVKRFTKSPCHFDWMFGPTKFRNTVDFLTGRKIQMCETVLWNRTLNLNIALDSYRAAQRNPTPTARQKLADAGLPLDINLN